MQAVNIQTTQNIELEYELAGLGERILAFVLDMAIALSAWFIIGLIFNLIGSEPTLVLNIIFIILAYTYRLICESLFNGQTLGKMALRIKVVKLDGSTPSFASFFLRWLMEIFDFFIVGLGVVFIILNKKAQRIGDILAGTTVVKMRQVSATNVRNKAIMDKVDEDYEPVFFGASHLTDDEVRLIKAALSAYKTQAVKRPINTLEKKLKEKYNINSELPTVKFLYTLLRDHTYYVTR